MKQQTHDKFNVWRTRKKSEPQMGLHIIKKFLYSQKERKGNYIVVKENSRENSKQRRIWSFHVAVLQMAAKKCSSQLNVIKTNNRIQWFSVECRKTKTKVITLANYKEHTQYSEPIKSGSNYTQLTQSAGKRVRGSHDWFRFYFGLDEKLARIF